MSQSLKIAAVALDIVRGDREKNLDSARLMVQRLLGRPDVVVLPELFSTGLGKGRAEMVALADCIDAHPAIDLMTVLAAELNAAICGSVLWYDKNTDVLTNRCIFIEPDGNYVYYDKRHLFGGEKKLLAAGTTPIPIVRFRSCYFALSVCYDLRFPCSLRNNAPRRYDVLLMPANWPQSRQFAWKTLLAARAIENQAYVVGANRAGTDDHGSYDAMSVICNALGYSVGNYHPDTQATYAEINLDELAQLRHDFPVLDDADLR